MPHKNNKGAYCVLVLTCSLIACVAMSILTYTYHTALQRTAKIADTRKELAALDDKLSELQVSVDLLNPDIAAIMDAVNSTARVYRNVKLTAYSVNSGLTKIGKKPVHNWTAAVSPALIALLGRRVYVKEINRILRITDTTHSDIQGDVLDIFVKDTTGWATREVTVIVID